MHASSPVPEAAKQRRADVDEKHRKIAELISTLQLDAILLRRQENIAWFASGADASKGMGSEELAAVALFVTPESRSVLATNDESARFFEEEVTYLGFQLKERRWYEGLDGLIVDICRGRKVGTDWPVNGARYVQPELVELRRDLNALEQRRLAALGQDLAHAIEATCRNTEVGDTELEVAGQLAHRMLRRGISPVRLYVAADDRSAEFRLAVPRGGKVTRRVQVAAIGRRFGLCAFACRTVCFGTPDEAFLQRYHAAVMVEASFIYQSSLNKTVEQVFQVARRIYEKTGFPNEWVLSRQGYALGYSPEEFRLTPDSTVLLGPGTAVGWSPSVGDARSGNTVLIGLKSYSLLTRPEGWPTVVVTVAGNLVELPDVLRRPAPQT